MSSCRKLEQLQSNIMSRGSLMVGFSGGVDSTFLLKVAHDLLGDRVVAVTARSVTLPAWELQAARDFARAAGIKHVVFELDELAVEDTRYCSSWDSLMPAWTVMD